MKIRPKTIPTQTDLMQLRWQLIELKVAYYEGSDLHPSWQFLREVRDEDYDRLETVLEEYDLTWEKVVGTLTTPSYNLVRQVLSQQRIREVGVWVSSYFRKYILRTYIVEENINIEELF